MTSASSISASHASTLDAIIEELLARSDAPDPRALDAILRRHPKQGRGFHNKREILGAYRARQQLRGWDLPESTFAERLRTCPTRSISGVTPVTVLTKPFPCPGRCVFCPSDVRMPKSYLADEPGCQRAAANRFDPYLQTWSRLAAYRDMGHPTDKIELLILGGTWSHYPGAYGRWFVLRCLEAITEFGAGTDGRARAARAAPAPIRPARTIDGRQSGARYNTVVAEALGETGAPGNECADAAAVARAQAANEHAPSRCVGLSIETRPDCVTVAEVRRLRALGVTKVQLGVQSLSDAVLTANQRGHDVATTRRAMGLLRACGFKLQVHWMPNLLGATPASDLEDFARLFDDPAVRPDELKVYPCSLIESAELMQHFQSGAWRPYTEEELVELLAGCLPQVPEWCRVTRVIRDIPTPDILVGNGKTNLRETVEATLRERGIPLREIRAREVRGTAVDATTLRIREHRYAIHDGEECFLEATTPDDRIAGFLRLTLPRASAPLEELQGSALIREVHVYGPATALGERSPGRAQHAGLGSRLITHAKKIAQDSNYQGVAVISAIGTRPWYRRLGFKDGPLYQHQAD